MAEADGGGTILRRYAPGDGVDEPVVWYEGTGTADRRWLHADERGSVVAVSDASGNMLGINTYDEFGKPGAANIGRFQYTGQKWISELGLYDYKARLYAPALGRFLQTDPIGYGSGPNIYAYVRGDPVNLSDPLGLADTETRQIITPWCPEPSGCVVDIFPWGSQSGRTSVHRDRALWLVLHFLFARKLARFSVSATVAGFIWKRRRTRKFWPSQSSCE